MVFRSLLIVLLALVSQTLYPMADGPFNKAKIATYAGLGISAGLVGYKWFTQSAAQRVTQSAAQKAAEEQADREKQKKYLDERMTQDCAQTAAEMALNEFELLAYEDREKLLPAVISVSPRANNLFDQIFNARERCISRHDDYQRKARDAEQKILRSEEPIALGALVISREFEPIDLINCLEKQTPEKLFIKNNTHPRSFFGPPLTAGQCGFVVFSDGDIQIHLHNSDRRALKELPHEQREFIKGLYHQRDTTITLDSDEYAVFKSLKPEMRACLERNYTLITPSRRMLNRCDTALSWAAQSFFIARLANFAYEERKTDLFGYITLCFLNTYSIARRHGSDTTSLPGLRLLQALIFTESFFNAPWIINKIKSFFPK